MMFSYGLLRGVRDRLLGNRYKGVGFKAYDLLTSDFIRDDEDEYIRFLGTVQVGSLNSNASFEVTSTLYFIFFTSFPMAKLVCAAISDTPYSTIPASRWSTMTPVAEVRSCSWRSRRSRRRGIGKASHMVMAVARGAGKR